MGTIKVPDNDRDYRCNLFGMRLSCFKLFENAAGFTAVYSAGALVTQTLSSYMSSQIPTLEKQFGLSSYESGIIMTFNDIGFIACMVLVSSIPRLVHIPRWLFGTMLLFGISGLLCSLPHFMFSTRSPLISAATDDQNSSSTMSGQTSKSNFFLCADEQDTTDNTSYLTTPITPKDNDQVDYSMKAVSIAIIGVGMVLQGVAKAPRSPFTTVYLDDGCDKKKTGFYLGKA